MRLLPAADRRWTAWRNGGGRTCEIAADPPGAGFADFHWRISIAEIATDGPFSAFPGVIRTFAPLQGAVRLTLDGGDPHLIDPRGEAFVFPGEAAVMAALVSGPVTVLNVIARPDLQVTTRRIPAGAIEIPPLPPGTHLFAASGQAMIGSARLAPLDALLVDGPAEGLMVEARDDLLLASILHPSS